MLEDIIKTTVKPGYAEITEKKSRFIAHTRPVKSEEEARAFIDSRKDRDKIVVEVLPLTNYVRSAEEHQHHLERYPEDCSYCHIPDEVLNKYRNQ